MKKLLKVVSFLALAAALSAAVLKYLELRYQLSDSRYLSTGEEYDDDDALCF